MDQVQQGDVLFQRVKQPTEKQTGENKSGVLAYGEVTGHTHKIVGGKALVTTTERPDVQYLRVLMGPVEVAHEEHGTVTLDEGLWRTSRVFEFDDEEELRVVID